MINILKKILDIKLRMLSSKIGSIWVKKSLLFRMYLSAFIMRVFARMGVLMPMMVSMLFMFMMMIALILMFLLGRISRFTKWAYDNFGLLLLS